MDDSNKILDIKGLKVYFEIKESFIKEVFSKESKIVKALDGVDLDINKGEILSLVGESGSGKTTLGKAILNLVPLAEGQVLFKGEKVDFKKKDQVKNFRQKAQMIFQDPYQSLDPKNLIIDGVAEGLDVNNLVKTSQERSKKVIMALEDSGLSPGESYLYKYPYELSGGQRQRVAIASALILEPDFIIADEPVSMLDVSVRSGILKLILELKEEKGLAFLFITHDLSLAWLISDRIAIMYLGRIVEIGASDRVIKEGLHPYTRALLKIMPLGQVIKDRKRDVLTGEISNPINLSCGCRFNTRCDFAFEKCREVEPELIEIEKGHFVACHLYNEKYYK